MLVLIAYFATGSNRNGDYNDKWRGGEVFNDANANQHDNAAFELNSAYAPRENENENENENESQALTGRP